MSEPIEYTLMTTQTGYPINVAGQELLITQAPDEFLNFAEAVTPTHQFCGTGDGFALASADEIIALRSAFPDIPNIRNYHVTRGHTLYFKQENTWYAATDDARDSFLLAERVNQDVTQRWFRKHDQSLTRIIDAAAKADRIIPAPKRHNDALNLAQEDGQPSPYETAKSIKAIIPHTTAQNATFLRSQGYNAGYRWDLTSQDLEKRVPKNCAEIRLVGVGGDGCSDFSDLIAYDLLVNVGRVRWVREKNSTGNKG